MTPPSTSPRPAGPSEGSRPSPRRHRIRLAVVLLTALAIVELVLELGIVAVAWQGGRDHRSVAQRLHLAKFLVRTLPPPEHPVELSPGIRYLGEFLGGEPTPRLLFPADGLLGHRLGCNVAVTIYGAWQITNDQCFAYSGGPLEHYQREKPPEIFRIIVLGGSTVEGIGAESPSVNLPGQLRSLLNERARRVPLTGHKRFEVINAGIAAYHSGLEYLYLLVDLVSYQPDLVIFYDGWNDSAHSVALTAAPERLFRGLTHEVNARRANESYTIGGALRHLGLALVVETALFAQRTAPGFAVWELIEDRFRGAGGEEASPSAIARSAEFYGQNIELAIGLAHQRGFALAAFLQPLIGVDGRATHADEQGLIGPVDVERRRVFYRDARARLARLRAEHSGEGICIADISESALRGVEGRAYRDWGHLLGVGNTAVAKTIISELDRCGLLP